MSSWQIMSSCPRRHTHVEAKRYLAATDPGDAAGLSETSAMSQADTGSPTWIRMAGAPRCRDPSWSSPCH